MPKKASTGGQVHVGGGRGSAGAQVPRRRRPGGWITDENLRQLSAAGLLARVWPASRLLVGVCVCRWLRTELLEQHEEVVLTVKNKVSRAGYSTSPHTFTGEQVAGTLCRYHGKRMTLIWTLIQSDTPGTLVMDDEGHWVAAEPCALLSGMEIARRSKNFVLEKLVCLDMNAHGRGDLSEGICAEGAEQLAKILEDCTSLQTLKLSCHQIGEGGVRALAGLFERCTGLTELDLGGNAVEKGVECLAACTNLLRLKLGPCGEDTYGQELPDVLECLSSLKDLDLSSTSFDNGKISEAVIESLHHHTQLTSLNLDSSNAWEGFDLPKSAPTLSRILLNNSASLTFLDLHSACLRPEGLRDLAGSLECCTALSTLHLNANHLELDGARVFASLPWEQFANLLTVDLSDNSLDPEGVQCVVGALARCRRLCKLYLARNNIGNRAEDKQAKADAAAALPHCKLVWNTRVISLS